MGPESKVKRGPGPAVFIQFSSQEPEAAKELSRLVKYFLKGSFYRVEHLAKIAGTTLKVYDDE